MTNTKYTAVVVALVFAVTFAGGAVTYAQFSDTETANGSFAAGTWGTTPSSSAVKGLSFVAFCVENDSSGSVTVTNRTVKSGGDSIEITYNHTFESDLVSVVHKAGQPLYKDKSPDGTVVSGEVKMIGQTGSDSFGRQPSAPCGDSAVAIKFEDDAGKLGPNTTKSYNVSKNPEENSHGNNGNGMPVSKTEIQDSATKTQGASPGTFGAQSIENTTTEIDNANDSNATPTATPTETTVETPSTPTETVTETRKTEAPTPTPTPTPTSTPTETETTNETPVDAKHILGNSSSGNATSGDEESH